MEYFEIEKRQALSFLRVALHSASQSSFEIGDFYLCDLCEQFFFCVEIFCLVNLLLVSMSFEAIFLEA